MKKTFCLIALFTLFIPTVNASKLNNIDVPNVYGNQFKINNAQELTHNQWYLNDIDISKAWEVSTGNKEIVIAVLDSGVNSEHPALSGRILPGYDFVNEDSVPNDDLGHGTLVAGIIAANADEKGITGIDFHSKILPIKVADSKGEVKDQDLIEGIQFAVDHEADIINMSFGTTKKSEEVSKAIMKAKEAGTVIVAASGNFFSYSVEYPAAYPGVIAVGAYNEERKPALFSNKGTALDLLAPGNKILSTSYKGDYEFRNGTSYAAPIVSAIAALLKAKHPDWTSEQIEWAIEQGAIIPNQKENWSSTYGYGMINAYNSLLIKHAPKDRNENHPIKINLNSGMKGFIELPMDVDSYHITPNNKEKITIKINAGFPNLYAELYDSHNNLVKTFEDTSSEGNTKMAFTFIPEDSHYSFLIKHKYGHWENKPYTIDVFSYNLPSKLLTSDQLASYFKKRHIISRENGASQLVTREDAIKMVLSSLEHKAISQLDWIEKAYELGIMISDQQLEPDEFITRGEMAVILYRIFSLPSSEYFTAFQDVQKGHWAFDAIQAFAINDISAGYGDNTFRPAERIKLEHAILFLHRVLQQSYYETKHTEYE